MNTKMEQLVDVKFCVELNETATETNLLQEAYGEQYLSRT